MFFYKKIVIEHIFWYNKEQKKAERDCLEFSGGI